MDKQCDICKEVKTIKSFHINGRTSEGKPIYYRQCKSCRSLKNSRKRAEDMMELSPRKYVKCTQCGFIYGKRYFHCKNCGQNNLLRV